jgi:hypothetical protein
MLPEVHQQRYRELQQKLEQVQQAIATDDGDRAALQQQVRDIQQFFQSQVMSLPMEEVDPSVVSRVQSFQTELHKQIRLLVTDTMFLASAKQSATVQQRQQQIRDRIEKSISFCHVLVGESGEGEMRG